MHFIRMCCLTAVPALAPIASSLAGAQTPAARPNFSGVWVLDSARTQPGAMTPMAMSYAIEQHGDTLRITRQTRTRRGEFTSQLLYGLDGRPWHNSVDQGGVPVEVSSILTWEGSTLVITSTLNAGGQELHQVERWSLDPNGRDLLADRTAEAMGQHFVMRLVLIRRPSP